MSKLSLEKMKQLKSSKNYTNLYISKLTGIPKSTIDKVFGGFHLNPSIDILQKIAEVLDCGIDDFIEYNNEPTSIYFKDRQTGKIAQELYEYPELHALLDAGRKLNPEALAAVVEMINQVKDKKNN